MGIFDRIADQFGELIATDEVRDHVELGAALLEQNDIEAAIREFDRALLIRPDHARASYLLSLAYGRKGELARAEQTLLQAIESRDDYADAHLALGETRRRRGRPELASESFRRVLESSASDERMRAQAYRGLGLIYLEQDDTARAVRELRKAAAGLPRDLEVKALLGKALLARENYDAARLCLERAAAPPADADEATEEDSPASETAENASSSREQKPPSAGDVVDAEVVDAESATDATSASDSEAAPADVHAPDADSSKAEVSDAETSESAAPAANELSAEQKERVRIRVDALSSLGELHFREKRSDEARDAWLEALRIAPLVSSDAVDAVLGLSRIASLGGDYLEAEVRADEAIAAAPDRHDAHLARARAYVSLAEKATANETEGADQNAQSAWENGLATFERAISLAPDGVRPGIVEEALRVALLSIGSGPVSPTSPDGDRALVARANAWADRATSGPQNEGASHDAIPMGDGPTSDGPTGDVGARPRRRISTASSMALSARALAALIEGRTKEATDLASRALAGDAIDARLAHAQVMFATGDRSGAAASLRHALEIDPRERRARALLSLAYRDDSPSAEEDGDLYAFLTRAHRRLQEPETGDLAIEVARLIESVDRPLLLTVMGEFNAGKSTFVNAFLGEEVAPMGITPTTATINILKYGTERGGRVVYLDGTMRNLAWQEVGPTLKGLSEAEAERIRWVEVLYPLEALQRVNVVDTPGLNSIRSAHEETARSFIAEADAVVWLFTCRQAGTESEREALLRIRREGKHALGVINMIDLLAGNDAGMAELLTHLDEGFGELVDSFVPFSAREALLGRDDPERLQRSNREGLHSVLEERFFSRATAIKRVAALHRLSAILGSAVRRGEVAVAAGPGAAIVEVTERSREAAARLENTFLDEERLQLMSDLETLYAVAAREVLEFARPRRWVFGTNQAAPADRDFLLDLIEEQLLSLVSGSRRRVALEVETALEALRSVDERAAMAYLKEELRVLDEQVYGRFRAFSRGFLRGGRVDRFFTDVLPKLDLGEHTIRRALIRDMPALGVLDAELLEPMDRWTKRFFSGLFESLERLSNAEQLRRLEIEQRLIAPLSTLAESVDEMVAKTEEPTPST